MRHTRVTAAILSATAAFLLLIVFLFASITMVMNDEARHSREYKELGIAQTMGMSQEEVLDSLMLVIDYMQGNTDSIEKEVTVYGEKVMMFNGPRNRPHVRCTRTVPGLALGFVRNGGRSRGADSFGCGNTPQKGPA